MSQQRPRDLLEFLRRASADDAPRTVDSPRMDPASTRKDSSGARPTASPDSKAEPKTESKTGKPKRVARPHRPVPAAPGAHVTVSQGDAPMVVLRRSQVVVAGIAAGLLILLAYLLGGAWSSGESPDQATFGAVGVNTIVVIEYDDTPHGRIQAKTLKGELARLGLDEVMIEQLDRDRKLWVTIGSWVSNPKINRQAVSLLGRVQKLRVQGSNKRQFADAYFARIER